MVDFLDREKYAYAAVQMSLLAVSMLVGYMLIASVASSIMYFYLCRKREKKQDYDLLVFAKSLRKELEGRGLRQALRKASAMASAPRPFKIMAKRMDIGDSLDEFGVAEVSEDAAELGEIVSFGVSSGSNIGSSLNAFISNMENRMEGRNRMMQNSLSMDSLSYIGVAFFVPLFGGICESIIVASGAMSAASLYSAARFFGIIVTAYIALMSYVMNAFRIEDRGSAFVNALQVTIIGTAVMRMASGLISYAI